MVGALPDQRLSTGEIINKSLTLYSENFVLFLGILALLLIPQAIIELVIPGLFVVTIVTSTYSLAALFLAINARYHGQQMTIMEAYSSVGVGTWITFLLASIVYYVVGVIGLILIIVPGVYWFVQYAFWLPAIAVERKDFGSGFFRSAELVSGNWWRVFGIGLLVIVIEILVQGVVSAILGHAIPVRLSSFASTVLTMFIRPFTYGALLVLFFDERARHSSGAV